MAIVIRGLIGYTAAGFEKIFKYDVPPMGRVRSLWTKPAGLSS
jgi:hypothetical protein